MITTINDHILIEPIKKESFMSSSKTTYEEIGVVKSIPADTTYSFKVGDKVYFDSWTAMKFPNGASFHWIVPLSAIKAYEQVS